MGAKQGRTKGNEQKAEYLESDGRHGKPGRKEEGRTGKRKRNREAEEANCEAETVEKRKGRVEGRVVRR